PRTDTPVQRRATPVETRASHDLVLAVVRESGARRTGPAPSAPGGRRGPAAGAVRRPRALPPGGPPDGLPARRPARPRRGPRPTTTARVRQPTRAVSRRFSVVRSSVSVTRRRPSLPD